jgi:hypothetical protein
MMKSSNWMSHASGTLPGRFAIASMSFTGDSIARQAHAVCLAASTLRRQLPLCQKTLVFQNDRFALAPAAISAAKPPEIAISAIKTSGTRKN